MSENSTPGGKEVVLHLDEATATDLEDYLLQLFEVVAAGAPVRTPSEETQERFSRVYREICHQLGRLTFSETMEAEYERIAREQDG
jgi:hypothetical protein